MHTHYSSPLEMEHEEIQDMFDEARRTLMASIYDTDRSRAEKAQEYSFDLTRQARSRLAEIEADLGCRVHIDGLARH